MESAKGKIIERIIFYYKVLSNKEVQGIKRGWKDKKGEEHFEYESKGWYLTLSAKYGPMLTFITPIELPFKQHEIIKLSMEVECLASPVINPNPTASSCSLETPKAGKPEA